MRLEEIALEDVRVGMRVGGSIRNGQTFSFYPHSYVIAGVARIGDECEGIAITYKGIERQHYYPLSGGIRLLVMED